MADIHEILADHKSRSHSQPSELEGTRDFNVPTTSEIPDLFFDEILIEFKLNRVEVLVLMYVYRRVWCRPNLYKEFGISQLMAHSEMAKQLKLSIDEIYQSLRKLESLGCIATIRSGQYFVRKYFSKENDEKFGQTYDDFEV
jgi:DNA-binding MarR family transcriptional regulator